MLPADDEQYLKDLDLEFELQVEGSMVCLTIQEFPLPAGYQPAKVDLLLRLPAGFPETPPDMWWTLPEVTYTNGAVPHLTEAREVHLGRTWQRWSRHFSEGQWRPGTDSLRSFVATIRGDLESGVAKVAA